MSAKQKPKFVQSLSCIGVIKTDGAAGVFCPENGGVESTDGVAFLGIKVKRSTLERLSGERVLIVIYPEPRRKQIVAEAIDATPRSGEISES